jgi:hypothetical protein
MKVQSLLLSSQYLQGTNRSLETWNVHGLAVKAAYQLGLHSRVALSRYSPVERESRTRTWFGCVLLDRYANFSKVPHQDQCCLRNNTEPSA